MINESIDNGVRVAFWLATSSRETIISIYIYQYISIRHIPIIV